MLQRSADKMIHGLFFPNHSSSAPQQPRPFVFSSSFVFIIPSQRKKNNIDEKLSWRNRKKWGERKMTYFSEDPPAHKPQILLPPFGSEALWDWKQWSRGQPPAESALCPTEGHMGVEGPQKVWGGASRPQTQRGPSHLGRKGSMGARQRARESPQTCERVPTGASWDWLGIVSLQHSGNGRKWQPRSRLLTQSKRKAFNCCEKSARKGKACC